MQHCRVVCTACQSMILVCCFRMTLRPRSPAAFSANRSIIDCCAVGVWYPAVICLSNRLGHYTLWTYVTVVYMSCENSFSSFGKLKTILRKAHQDKSIDTTLTFSITVFHFPYTRNSRVHFHVTPKECRGTTPVLYQAGTTGDECN